MAVGGLLGAIQARAVARGMTLATLARASGMQPSNLRRMLKSTTASPQLGSVMRLLEPLRARIGPAGAAEPGELAAFLDGLRRSRGLRWEQLLEPGDVHGARLASAMMPNPERLPLDLVMRLADALEVPLVLVDAEAPASSAAPRRSRARSAPRSPDAETDSPRAPSPGASGSPPPPAAAPSTGPALSASPTHAPSTSTRALPGCATGAGAAPLDTLDVDPIAAGPRGRGRALRAHRRDHGRRSARCPVRTTLLLIRLVLVVHGDFKPENVVIDERGRVRVVDFGLARWSGEEIGQAGTFEMNRTLTQGPRGTPGYIAPEVFLARGDARSDQYAFAVQENGTRSSSPQLRQQVRTKPSSKSPQPAKPSSSAFTNAGSGPARSSQRSRNSARCRRTSTAASHSWV